MKKVRLFVGLVIMTFFATAANAQTTEFNYQGSLKDGVNSANGNYDFEFGLYDSLSGGNQIGATLTKNSVAVADGTFAIKLDFGSQFPGANRFLEIHVRPNGGGAFTPLTPRQMVNSSPYSVRSLSADAATNATQLGGVAANQFVLTNDIRLADARSPTAGSDNYIQNSNIGGNPSFSITGSGYANGPLSGVVIDARSQLNLSGQKILGAAGPTNLIFGIGAGPVSTGTNNTFLGVNAGQVNSTGSSNTFVGTGVGVANSTGSSNTFIGSGVGTLNTGSSNTFVGTGVGAVNTTGTNNSFFGFNAGNRNTGQGQNGTFIGSMAGLNNTTGTSNTFVGTSAGDLNTTAGSNSFFGAGSGSFSTGSDNTFLGSSGGPNNTLGNRNTFVGRASGQGITSGNDNTSIGNNVSFGSGSLSFATAIGSGSVASISNSIYLGRPDGSDAVRIAGPVILDGTLVVGALGGTTGNNHLCLNTANRLSGCTTNFAEAGRVEELQKIIDTQQQHIEEQKQVNEKLRDDIRELKALLCEIRPDAKACSKR